MGFFFLLVVLAPWRTGGGICLSMLECKVRVRMPPFEPSRDFCVLLTSGGGLAIFGY